ncbi:Ig-like domain-containing protein [Capnocytophaga canimorsus]|uniref:Ig-like domain-containing protein n=1 Tax=Capnocytophaga canimorsus TaxID=28188 RepID=UPI0037CFBA9F
MRRLIFLFVFVLFVGLATAQSIINVSIETDYSLGTNNFEAGKLTVEANIPNGTSLVTITLPDGVTYKNNSLVFDTSISGAAGNPTASSVSASGNQLTFNLGVTSAGAVKFSIVKEMSPQAHFAVRNGQQLKDKVKIQNGTTSDEKVSNDHYFYKYPIMNLQQMDANTTVVKNTEYTGSFVILNGGTATAEDVYFTIEYPEGISGGEVRLNSATGTILTSYRTEGNKKFFKIAKTQFAGANGLVPATSVTVFDKYTVTVNCLDKNITYTANWGKTGDVNDWYQADDTANRKLRRVATPEGEPRLEYTRKDPTSPNVNNGYDNIDYTKTYFIIDKGLCATVGESVGKVRLSFTNYGSNTSLSSAIYKVAIYIKQESSSYFPVLFKPDNVKVGTKVLTTTPVDTSGLTNKVDFSSLNADPDGSGGLDDLDGDGVYDDLPSMATFVLEYDLIKVEDSSNKCGSTNYYSYLYYRYDPYITYQTLCGNKMGGQGADPLQGARYLRDWTFYRNYQAPDASFVVPTLFEGEAAKQVHFAIGQAPNYWIREVGSTGQEEARWRIRYKITLPSNVTASNFKWYKSNGYEVLPPTSGQTVIPTISGNVYTFEALEDNVRGYITMDLAANCGASSNTTIDYEISHLDHYGKPQQCAVRLICDSKPIRIICGDDCDNDGPQIDATYAERAENSLGWTDHTMQIRHTKATLRPIAPELLEYALEHDDVEVFAKGKQNRGNADNLYYRFKTGKNVALKPKSVLVKFTNGTRAGTQYTINADPSTLTQINSGSGINRQMTFDWNLTQALGGQPLLQGETFEVTATYQVTKYDWVVGYDISFDNYTTQRYVGESSHFYMKRAGTELYCGAPRTPENMKIILLYPFDGTNGNQRTNACIPKDVDGNLLHIGKRHKGSNISLTKHEFRPDRLIKSFKFTLPKTYSVTERVRYQYRIAQPSDSGEKFITKYFEYSDFIKSETADFVTYEIHNEYDPVTKTYKLPPGLISKTNDYATYIRVTVIGSCRSTQSGFTTGKNNTPDDVIIYPTYYDDFYHYAGINLDPSVSNPPVDQLKTISYDLDMINKPTIKLESSGNNEVVLTEAVTELKVKLTNLGTISKAPYTWISIPDVQGVEILGFYDGADAITHSPTITGQKMYHLSKQGLAPNTSKEYRVLVRLTNCQDATLSLYAGWNCTSFSKGYNDPETCSSANTTGLDNAKTSFTLKSAASETQLERTVTPYPETPGSQIGRLHMCEDNWYEYEINNGKPGNVVDIKMSIAKATGIDIHEVQAFYPSNSTVTRTLTAVTVGNNLEYNLLNAGEILKGTAAASGTNSPERKIRVRVNVKPKCDFRVGSTFSVEVLGKNVCGGALEGTRDNAITAGVDGVNSANYTVNNTLVRKSGNANYCATGVGAVYEGMHQIQASGGNSSGADGKVIVKIPDGFQYVTGTFTVTGKNGTFADPVLESTTQNTDHQELVIKIPSGMQNLNYFKYEITIKQENSPAVDCAQLAKIDYYTVDVANNVSCNGTACPSIIALTSPEKTVAIETDRAKLSIENLSINSAVTGGQEQLNFAFDIRNNSATIGYTGDLKISFYDDTDNNGIIEEPEKIVGKEIVISGKTFNANDVVQNLTGTVSFPENQICRLYVKISGQSNHCLCDSPVLQAPIPNPISGLVTDLTACVGEQVSFVYVATAPNYQSYQWTATNIADLAYLSSSNIKDPVFTYTGVSSTNTRTITYGLKVTRTNGCESTQSVTVTIKPSSAITVTSPQDFCDTATVLDLKSRINPSNPNVVKVYNGSLLLDNATTLTHATTYQVTQTPAGQCESTKANVQVNVLSTPSIPVVQVVEKCGVAVTTATITNYDASLTYELTPNTATVSGNQITGLQIGIDYTLTVKRGNCLATSANFSAKAALPASVSPTVTDQMFCPSTAMATFIATPTAGHTLRWYDTVTSTTFETTVPNVSLSVTTKTTFTKYVSQVNAEGCESDKVPVTITIDDTQAPVIDNLADLTISCQATDIDNQVNNWLSTIAITDACGSVATTTNNYQAVKPTDWCNVSGNTVTVTVTSTDTFGNTATKTVFIKLVTIDAVNDNFGVVQANTTTTGSVLDNDKLGTASATTANVEIKNVVSPHAGITIATTDGKVSIANDVPSGTYTLTYTICARVNGTPCDEATVTVTVENGIVAEDDDLGPVVSGGTTTQTVISNDKLNGTPVVIGTGVGQVTLTPIITPTGITIDATNGKVTVGTNVSSGVYTLTYKICENGSNPLNCDDATVTVTVENGIVADDDDLGTVVSGGTTTQTVISNDKLNGTPVVIGTGVGQVTLTPIITPTGITIDATNGKVTVGTNVSSGVYTLTYKICENGSNPLNCDDATVTVTVENGIVADDDDLGPVVSGGTTTQTVISNDKLNGTSVVIGTGVGQVTLTPLITPTGITLNGDGKVTVGTNVSSGVYTLTYKICENGATPDNCDEATVTITVQNGIVAEDDDLGPVVSGGTTTQTVISNDKLNGTPVVIGTGTGEVTLTPIITPTGITFNGDGKVTVGTNVSSGVYTLTYKICENGATPDNCDDATVTVTVQNGIVAEDDNLGPVVSGGTTTQTVISNDKLNGTPVVIGTGTGEVTLTPIVTPTGITIDATNGKVTVGTNVSSGVYTLTYKICENGATPDNCDEATVTITVENSIVADNDDLGPVVSGGTTTQTVISNDKLNGTPVVIGTGVGQVTLTPLITPTGITIDTTNGKVSVANNVPSGEYTLTYTICENGSNPLNCDAATVTITVLSSNTVLAISDINNTYLNTSVSGNVSTNDEDPQGDALEFSLLTASNHQGHSLVFNSDGTYVFTPKEGFTGVVVYEYEVCDKGMPRACATATLTIGVFAQLNASANTVFANDDAVRTKVGTPVLISVLANDIDVEGDTFEITSHPSHTSYGSLSLSNGKFIYTPNAGYVGVDSFTYTICDNRTTDKACSTATVRVLILSDTSSNTTFANDDAYNGDKNRVISGNVLSNDVDLEGNGQTTTLLSGATKGVVVLNADGTFSYKPNMGYVGPDSFTYKLCDDGTPEACAVATVYLTVNESESIVANNDDFTNTPIRNMVGGVLGSVLTNDTYLGVPISSGQVSGVTLLSDGGLTGVTLDGSGHLTIPQGATEGTYTLTYEVCEKSKGSCATAEIYVRIIKGCPLNFYNGLSNNEDGTNDGFVIDGIECYPKNKVRIYNRWGVKVFETEGYNNKERLFRGISNGRVTVDVDKKLPQGTYYYVLEYTDASNQTHSEAGWLYIKR